MVSARKFNPTQAEYENTAALHHDIWPDEKQFPADLWREEDEDWPEGMLQQRFVLQKEERIIGWGSCFEKYWQHQPGTVHIEFHVHPLEKEFDHILYEAILEFLDERYPRPQILATEAREDRMDRIRFLEREGFEAAMRSPRSFIKVADFDDTRFIFLNEKLTRQGIEITTLAKQQREDPDWKQNLFDMRLAIVQDVPSVEPPIRPTMAEFEQMILDDPALNEDAWFIAVDRNIPGHHYIGMSNLWINDPAHKRLDTGLTGVLQSYRRLGIATALKAQTIMFAKSFGAETIETDNEENNPVIDINMQLGFQPKAAWVSYRKNI